MALNNPYALSFDGVDDRVVASAIPLSQLSQWTAEFWIRSPRAPQLSTKISQPLVNDRTFAFAWDHKVSWGVQSVGYQYATDDRWYLVQIQKPLLAHTWYHIAATYDGNTLAIYLNGELDNSIDTPNPPISLGYQMSIGAGLSGQANFFRGDLDEIRIWNYARSAEEIYTYKDRYLTGNESGLLRLYRFDTGSGDIAHDSSPNANHGTIYGATWVPGIIDLKKGDRITGSITFRGHSSMFLSAVKTAVGKITFRGGSFMSLIGLVLRELEGIYQISSSEIISRNQPVLSTDLANYIEVWINPRVPADQAEEVYRSKEPEPIAPGESKTFNLKLNKEPIIEAVASLEDAGANLAITNTKFYSGSAEITVKNSGATEQTCIIVVQARPLELRGRRKIVVKDEESILDHGLVKYTFDSPLVQDEASARDIGQKILRLFSVARANIEIEWRGDPALELADIVQIPEFEKLGVSKKENFYVTRQLLEVVEGGLDATLSGRKVPRPKEGD